MITNVYIDGFNLYYGALKTRWPNLKWLDIRAMCLSLLPTRQVGKIRYFTAPVIPPLYDPQMRSRQDAYLRALRTLTDVYVHDGGWFVLNPKLREQFPLAYPYKNYRHPPQRVYVQIPEEKGSDVNLASYLLFDCFGSDYDEAVVISNDADLMVPIAMVVNEFHKPVGVINPHPRFYRSAVLAKVASWTFQDINKRYLANNQLPLTLTDAQGTITKPLSW